MKPIELTEEHKSKLLEMCKTLFPEYEEIRFNINAKEYGIFIVMDNGNIIIHWFEFCMTHLSTVIFNKKYNFDHMMTADLEQEVSYEWNSELMDRVSFHVANPTRTDNWHPVDYLYEEFKKLK